MASKLLSKNQKKAGRFTLIEKLNKKRLIIILAVIFISYLFYSNYRNRNTVIVETDTVNIQDLSEIITASGNISAEERADMNFLTSGEISTIEVKEGDIVKKGEILARLDTTNLYQAYLQAEANLRKADATLANVYDEIQGHDDDETFAQRDSRTTAETARDVAYRSFIQASENLSNATLRAPFSGIVALITEGVGPGVYVTPATAQIIVVDPDTVIFEADVNETNVSKIYLGQKVNITLDAFPEQELVGNVNRIGVTSVTTSTGGTAYPVQITIPGSIGLKYKIGMNGDAEFVVEEKRNVLTVPITAVVEEDEENKYVWISDDGVARKSVVETSLSSINEVEITSGLEEGQTLVVRPPSDMEEGKRIITEED